MSALRTSAVGAVAAARRERLLGRVPEFPLLAGSWVAALLILASIVAYYTIKPNAYDLSIISSGIHQFLHHANVYRAAGWGRYLHPPSSLLLLAPLGLVDFDHIRVPYLIAETAAIAAGVLLSLRLIRVPAASVTGGVAIILAGISAPVIEELRWSNVDGMVLPLVVGSLIAIDRKRDLTAGFLLGVALAFKPTAAPLLLVPLLWGRWRTLSVAVALPAMLFVAGSALLVHPLDFITVTVPVLVSGLGHDLIGGNLAIAAVGSWIGAPSAVTLLVRLAVLAAAVLAVRSAYRRSEQTTDQLLLLSGLILVTADLVPAYSYIRYLIYLVPIFAWLLLVRRGMPGLIGAAGLACMLVPYSPALDAHFWIVGQLDLFRFSAGAAAVFVALVVASLPAREGRAGAPAPAA